jgi:hypothetical protein
MVDPPLRRLESRLADRWVHPSYGFSIFIVYFVLLAAVSSSCSRSFRW